MAPTRTDLVEILGPDAVRSAYCGEVRVRDRNHADVKWRASGDPAKADVRILTGYPAVFSQRYVLWESKNFVVSEEVAPGFFDDVLDDDCHLNYSHESPSAMCRNGIDGPGGMQLSVDAHGLRVHAQMPMDDMDVQRLAPKMDRGVVDQMSYAFTVADEDCLISTDEEGRTSYHYVLKKCRELFDVCVCPLGANSQTEVALRSLVGQLAGRSLEGRATVPDRSEEGPEAAESRSEEGAFAKERALALASAECARSPFRPREGETDA